VNWDEEVDVICTGSGVAGLASAIAVVDAGGDVFVADSSDDPASSETHVPVVGPRVDPLHPWLGVDVRDPETNEYFAALSSDLGPLSRSTWEVEVPISVVHQPAPVGSGRTVAPFIGARLRDWAARCLASPYGFLHTRVSDWRQLTTLHTADGEAIEAAEIGSMAPDPGNVGGAVLAWLTAQACDRRIEAHPGSSLQRIVFEEGDAVGAVFTTPDGSLAIRARHGVTVATGGPQVNAAASHQLLAGDAALRVCLVGRTASRFRRVELLTSEPLDPCAPPNCRPMNRQLHVNLHETHTQSHTWRCGKVHGYPPLGQ
jgi:FAD binding domain